MSGLSKSDRETVRTMFGGRCAYCGCDLGSRWHADHLEPVIREIKYVRDRGFVPTGKLERPENNKLANMMPACPPCNIDKHSMSLETWREKLTNATRVLTRNNPTYRHALRFGLISETAAPVRFHFEIIEPKATP